MAPAAVKSGMSSATPGFVWGLLGPVAGHGSGKNRMNLVEQHTFVRTFRKFRPVFAFPARAFDQIANFKVEFMIDDSHYRYLFDSHLLRVPDPAGHGFQGEIKFNNYHIGFKTTR